MTETSESIAALVDEGPGTSSYLVDLRDGRSGQRR